jgi:hypothetical protein
MKIQHIAIFYFLQYSKYSIIKINFGGEDLCVRIRKLQKVDITPSFTNCAKK